ncbi:hypothetical protein SAMN05216522_10384 [Rosenbergiella nectarea]|uniref:Uncharacterized protein n=1 Tax=Rosenbergiella nectarea TaxID=988801 RepID=A0A1H9G681_9GAMM|nr:hypothetical protein SAMN05216522_10384 [Rosenbergiella nectarea]
MTSIALQHNESIFIIIIVIKPIGPDFTRFSKQNFGLKAHFDSSFDDMKSNKSDMALISRYDLNL